MENPPVAEFVGEGAEGTALQSTDANAQAPAPPEAIAEPQAEANSDGGQGEGGFRGGGDGVARTEATGSCAKDSLPTMTKDEAQGR